MAGHEGTHPGATPSLRDQLEHLEQVDLRDATRPAPSRNHSGEPLMSSATDLEPEPEPQPRRYQLSDAPAYSPQQHSGAPSRNSSIHHRQGLRDSTQDPTSAASPTVRVRFSDELVRTRPLQAQNHTPSPYRTRPSLQLDTGLYTIESNVDDMGAQRERQRNDRSEALSPRRGRQMPDEPSPGSSRSSLVASPTALTRPHGQDVGMDGTVKRGGASLADTKATLANYRNWAARQRERQREWMEGPLGRFRSKTGALYRCYIIEGLLRRKPIPPSEDGRHVPLDPGAARRKPFKDERTGRPYVSNFIRSSRYTVYDFLPKQLFFQFSKLANFYFLIIGIMQMIPGLSTTGTYTTIGPLIAFVCISMGKEGYDDYRRYRLDKLENKSKVQVLDLDQSSKGNETRGGFFGFFRNRRPELDPEGGRVTEMQQIGTGSDGKKRWSLLCWEDIRVGDIVRLKRDENVPADIVLLHATGPNRVAYIDTMALDGETNLKNKQACPLLSEHCGSVAEMGTCNATIVSEDPNLDLYNYEGRVMVNGEVMPLTSNQVVYRGSTIRNTNQVTGLVINTGEECKIRMNANKNVHAKAPEMQSVVNRIVLLLVLFVILLSVGLTISNAFWRQHYETKAWYLKGATVPFKEIIIGFVIEFNTLIPLSLYVSLEIIKLGQLFLLQDVEMYDPVSDTPMTANTTTILENLGQVSYVFSDKTGTLTENLMKFRKMSVAGVALLHDLDVKQEAEESERAQEQDRKRRTSRAGRRNKSRQGSEIHMPKPVLPMKPEQHREPLIGGSQPRDLPPRGSSMSQWRSTARPANAQPEMNTEDLIGYMRQNPHTPFSRRARHFVLCMALCHTCLPEKDEDGEISFQAASPDESALVEAARDLGYLLVDRATQTITLQFQDLDGNIVTEKYEALDVIEFSSKRKRMSIVIRMPDGKICIFTKGADSMILPRLRLNSLAIQKASVIERRASQRKSVEQEMALRRRSIQSVRSVRRESKQLARAASTMSSQLRSSSLRSQSRAASIRRSATALSDEVDHWLTRRETEELDGTRSVISPQQSIRGRQSVEPVLSAMAEDPYGGLVDEALAVDDAAVFERCFQHIDDFASEGLRTLIFAYRYLDEDEYKKWKAMYHEATTSLEHRQERIEEVAELIEQDFDLAGATAIEDKLQQGVPETIDKLRRANIHVWMLTGDKRETAINIAHSARICKPYSEIYVMDATEGDLHEKLAATLVDVGRGMVPHSVVVIDGNTLSIVEEEEGLRRLLFDLVARVDSVICCRASPSQKATLVKCIRKRVRSAVTLAIGDGANDIAMIQASHVGIGLSGREGRQAARIADYSIAQFRFLQRLLFVHGRWNYIRTAKYILGTFWKEVLFYLVQAQYQRYNGYTGTSIYEPTSLTVFNTLFTSLPVILLGIFEKDLAAETLLAVPELYSYGQKNKGFSFVKYLAWMALAAVESVIIFTTMYTVYQASVSQRDQNLFAMGSLAFTVCVIFINLKMLVIELHNRTIVSFLGLFISVSGWFVWNLFLGAIYKKSSGPYMVRNAFVQEFGRSGVWWLTGIVTLAALVLLEAIIKLFINLFKPSDQALMQEIEKLPGVMAVMGDHAASAERGEVGVALGPDFYAPAAASDAKRRSPSVKSVASASSVHELDEWRGGSAMGAGSGASSRQSGRLYPADEYVPPPFTPPVEEDCENHLDMTATTTTTTTMGPVGYVLPASRSLVGPAHGAGSDIRKKPVPSDV